jgi:hypothetical protein
MGMGKAGPISAHQQLMSYYGSAANVRCRAEWRELVISTCVPNGVQPTTEMDSEFVSIVDGGFNFNVVTADGTAREILYLAISEDPVSGAGDLTLTFNETANNALIALRNW